MKIDREKFLNNLQMVKAGLSPREFIEQSNCFVFQGTEVMTFNDEIACRKSIDFELKGAVQAELLLSILEKMDDPELKVLENGDGQLEFRGKRKRFWLTRDLEIFLSIDKVEKVEKWKPLTDEFSKAVKSVRRCVSMDETKFVLTCVHIGPDYIEACDNRQLMRYKIKVPLIKDSVLVRGAALAQITDLGMSEIAITDTWVHFRNGKGLVFSCRKYLEEYPDLDHILQFKGKRIDIPRGLVEAKERASLFASDQVGDPVLIVTLKAGRLHLTGEGLSGGYEEIKRISYTGDTMKFIISPEVLEHVSNNYKTAEISSHKLRATDGDKWEYVTVLGSPHAKSEPAEEEEEEDAD